MQNGSHARIKERKLKQEIRRKRAELLIQFDILNEQRCDKCKNYSSTDNKFLCDCDAAIKIREIGKQLDNLVAPRKCESDELLETLFVIENLTPQLYARLKYLKVRDKVIYDKVGIGQKAFASWKDENGFLKKYRRRVKS